MLVILVQPTIHNFSESSEPKKFSLMPEGLNTGLSLQDFADIVAYLESLKEAVKK